MHPQLRRCGVREAELNIELLDLVSTPAIPPEGFRGRCREVPFVPKADDLALATSHLAQSSSASRVTAAQAGFFVLSQSGERPER
jgi:hypothetical protein